MKVIYQCTTSDEGLYDIEEGMYEAVEDADIPVDAHGFKKGTFKITVTWSEDEHSTDV